VFVAARTSTPLPMSVTDPATNFPETGSQKLAQKLAKLSRSAGARVFRLIGASACRRWRVGVAVGATVPSAAKLRQAT
jgi:hypothetical protein